MEYKKGDAGSCLNRIDLQFNRSFDQSHRVARGGARRETNKENRSLEVAGRHATRSEEIHRVPNKSVLQKVENLWGASNVTQTKMRIELMNPSNKKYYNVTSRFMNTPKMPTMPKMPSSRHRSPNPSPKILGISNPKRLTPMGNFMSDAGVLDFLKTKFGGRANSTDKRSLNDKKT